MDCSPLVSGGSILALAGTGHVRHGTTPILFSQKAPLQPAAANSCHCIRIVHLVDRLKRLFVLAAAVQAHYALEHKIPQLCIRISLQTSTRVLVSYTSGDTILAPHVKLA